MKLFQQKNKQRAAVQHHCNDNSITDLLKLLQPLSFAQADLDESIQKNAEAIARLPDTRFNTIYQYLTTQHNLSDTDFTDLNQTTSLLIAWKNYLTDNKLYSLLVNLALFALFLEQQYHNRITATYTETKLKAMIKAFQEKYPLSDKLAQCLEFAFLQFQKNYRVFWSKIFEQAKDSKEINMDVGIEPIIESFGAQYTLTQDQINYLQGFISALKSETLHSDTMITFLTNYINRNYEVFFVGKSSNARQNKITARLLLYLNNTYLDSIVDSYFQSATQRSFTSEQEVYLTNIFNSACTSQGLIQSLLQNWFFETHAQALINIVRLLWDYLNREEDDPEKNRIKLAYKEKFNDYFAYYGSFHRRSYVFKKQLEQLVRQMFFSSVTLNTCKVANLPAVSDFAETPPTMLITLIKVMWLSLVQGKNKLSELFDQKNQCDLLLSPYYSTLPEFIERLNTVRHSQSQFVLRILSNFDKQTFSTRAEQVAYLDIEQAKFFHEASNHLVPLCETLFFKKLKEKIEYTDSNDESYAKIIKFIQQQTTSFYSSTGQKLIEEILLKIADQASELTVSKPRNM